jgi:hypothetical protein
MRPEGADLCPDCGYSFLPKPEPVEKSALTDEQAAAMAAYIAASHDRDEPMTEGEIKVKKWLLRAVVGFVIPTLLFYALEQMHVFGDVKAPSLQSVLQRKDTSGGDDLNKDLDAQAKSH